ncbi:hypothetical protein [Lactobacillus taiwanensis]|uniref:hypothetical protein n=1 Tax=Lactobacillus taiwanensis TaxID=508451 RepID=UPI0025A94570|nr:hypothetical protein [Lactobacillus taiwanensis]
MSVINTLAERSWDLGVDTIFEGEFNSLTELKEIFESVYPWELNSQDEKELIEQLLENEYLTVESDDIYEIKIVDGNKLYTRLSVSELLNLHDKSYYDEQKNNFLLGFSNSGWLFIDAAIDLATGTIGYFNPVEKIYQAVRKINSDDVEMYKQILDDYEEMECATTLDRVERI